MMILTPSNPLVPGYHFFLRGGGGGGAGRYGQNLRILTAVPRFLTQVRNKFFLINGPPNQWQVLGPNPGYPRLAPLWALAGKGLAIFRLACTG